MGNDNPPPKPKANLRSFLKCLMANVKEWVIDSGATRHIVLIEMRLPPML